MLLATGKDGMSLVEWGNAVVAIAGLMVAVFALLANRRAARAADRANDISRGGNELAERANRVAQEAMELQLDESRLRLVVKPRMMSVVGDGEDSAARPVVEIINLSAFPVTIQKIHWKTNRKQKAWLYWKNPSVTAPFGSLPARLPPREALTAIGTPRSFETLDDLLAVQAAVAFTACGESVEGMTDQWREFCDRLQSGESDIAPTA